MTYSIIDSGIDTGTPVFLYKFTQGASSWTYSNTNADITYNTETYTSATIRHDNVIQGSKIERLTLPLKVPRNHPIATVALDANNNGTPLNLTILRAHGDPDTDGTEATFKGRLVSVTTDGQIVSLKFETLHSTMQRNGLRARFQRGCRHVLYGTACGVNLASYASAQTVSAISGRVVTVSAHGQDDSYYTGGIFEFSGKEVAILSQTGNDLTLKFIPDGLVVTSAVNIYPGCPLTLSVCNNRFNNSANYGGWPFTPVDNPVNGFSGKSLY